MVLGFHHIGTFLLFAATILLLVSTITAPVVKDIGFLKVTLANGTSIRRSSVVFGSLGHCVLDVMVPGTNSVDMDYCFPRTVGYPITSIIQETTGIAYSSTSLDKLTGALILHPIATGVTFFAFLVAALSNRLGFLFSALIASIAWLIVLVTLIIDFVIFGAIKSHVNSSGTAGVSAAYGVAVWLTVAAFVSLFFGTLTTCFSCVTNRRRSRGEKY